MASDMSLACNKHMKLSLLTAVVLAGAVMSEAFGVSVTAEKLRHDCRTFIKCIENGGLCPSDAEASSAAYCNGYIKGFWDGRYFGLAEADFHLEKTETFVGKELAKKYGMYCTTEGVTTNQAAEVFVKYMDSQPEKLYESAREMLFNSFVEAFPCEQ